MAFNKPRDNAGPVKKDDLRMKRKDIVLILFFAIILTSVSMLFDFHEQIYRLTRPLEPYDLDEFVVFLPFFLMAGMVWFSYRRAKEANHELTMRKRAEGALRESQAKYRNLTESLGELIYRADPETFVTTYVNRAVERIYGYTVEEFLGDPTLWESAIHPDDKERVFVWFSEAQRKMEFGAIEYRIIRKDKTVRWAQDHASWEKDQQGNVVSLNGVMYDITERKQAEEQIRRLSSVVEQSIDGIAISDFKSKLIYVNDAFAQMHGYSRQEMIGMKIENLHNEAQMDELKSVLQQLETTGSWMGEIGHARKDGTSFPAYMSTTLLTDDEGKPAGFIRVARDITEKKKLEAQLRQSQKMESIAQLTGGIAHDFNNILSAVAGFANLIEMRLPADDPSRPHLDEILKASERGAKLNQSLLAFSREQIMEPRPVDLNEIIRSVEKLVGTLITEDITLKTELAAGELTVMADPAQIDQVLMNLATNARDAMPDGGLLLIETATVELDNEFIKRHFYGEPGTYALLSVTDTGTGMDEITMMKIFEPFFTTKEPEKGTGLGLAMTYGIIKQHNGFINVYSKVGKGTTFKIYLAVINAEVEKTKPAEVVSVRYGTETILVAEDDEALRKLAKTILENVGYNVIEAEDGEEAIDKFMHNKEKIQLLLLDLIMPKKNGREVYEALRETKPGIKALFLSGYTANLIHEKGILGKEFNFIMKPVGIHELLLKVREVLDK